MQLTCHTRFSPVLLELLPFSLPSFFGGGVYCPMRAKAFIDRATQTLRGFLRPFSAFSLWIGACGAEETLNWLFGSANVAGFKLILCHNSNGH
jgi:hypothetical protein